MAKSRHSLLFFSLDYRAYLKSRFDELKTNNGRAVSYRAFVKRLGFKSSSFLKMVLDGKRNLSSDAVERLNRYFQHDKKQAIYFEYLVLFNQAKFVEERSKYLERLIFLRPVSGVTELDKKKYAYFSSKDYVILREMVSLPGFSPDVDWIKQRLSYALDTASIKAALKLLVDLELIGKNKKGHWEQTDNVVATPQATHALEVYKYHLQMLQLADSALRQAPPHLREFAALTIPVQAELIPEIRRKIESFQDELIKLVNEHKPTFDEVFQLNLQFFPVTQK